MNVAGGVFDKMFKIKQLAFTLVSVDGIHLIGSCLVKPVGFHVIFRLSQSEFEVSHALIAHYHGNQWNSSLGLN